MTGKGRAMRDDVRGVDWERAIWSPRLRSAATGVQIDLVPALEVGGNGLCSVLLLAGQVWPGSASPPQSCASPWPGRRAASARSVLTRGAEAASSPFLSPGGGGTGLGGPPAFETPPLGVADRGVGRDFRDGMKINESGWRTEYPGARIPQVQMEQEVKRDLHIHQSGHPGPPQALKRP